MIAPWSAPRSGFDCAPAAPAAPVAIILASDAGMFEQLKHAIESIDAHCRYSFDFWVLALDLGQNQLDWLEEHRVRLFTDFASIPCFPDAPIGALAMTCRPYLRELIPGYDVYLWVDADIRITDASALDLYLQSAFRSPESIAISQETDPTYAFVGDPETARKHHTEKYERIAATYGAEVAETVRYFTPFNAGIFALHRASPVWDAYRENLESAMAGGFGHLKEQDALNLAVIQAQKGASVAPPCLNWLCSTSLPRLDEAAARWTRPTYPFATIGVLHLTNSNGPMALYGETLSRSEFYLHIGLPV